MASPPFPFQLMSTLFGHDGQSPVPVLAHGHSFRSRWPVPRARFSIVALFSVTMGSPPFPIQLLSILFGHDDRPPVPVSARVRSSWSRCANKMIQSEYSGHRIA